MDKNDKPAKPFLHKVFPCLQERGMASSLPNLPITEGRPNHQKWRPIYPDETDPLTGTVNYDSDEGSWGPEFYCPGTNNNMDPSIDPDTLDDEERKKLGPYIVINDSDGVFMYCIFVNADADKQEVIKNIENIKKLKERADKADDLETQIEDQAGVKDLNDTLKESNKLLEMEKVRILQQTQLQVETDRIKLIKMETKLNRGRGVN